MRTLGRAVLTVLVATVGMGMQAAVATGSGAPAPRGAGPTARPVTAMSGSSPFGSLDCHAAKDDMKIGQELDGTMVADPSDPSRLLAVWMQDSGAGLSIAASDDGGRSWAQKGLPGWTACSGNDRWALSFDPSLDMGPDGTAYVTSVVSWEPLPDGNRNYFGLQHLGVSRSTDGGSSWDGQQVLPQPPGITHVDTPHVVADPFQEGRAHVSWAGLIGTTSVILHSTTADAGLTWSTPRVIHVASAGKAAVGNRAVIPSKDELVVVFAEFVPPVDQLVAQLVPGAPSLKALYPASNIVAVSSNDGGTSWSSPTTVATVAPSPATDPDTGELIGRGAPYVPPSAASDDAGRAWVSWSESPTTAEGRIWLAERTPGGAWQQPVEVGGAIEAQTFWPTLAASPDGALGVMFYDLRSDEPDEGGHGELTTEVWLRTSVNGGRSWAEQRLGGPFDLRSTDAKVSGLPYGDQQGLVALPCGFGAAFAMADPIALDGVTDYFFANARTACLGSPDDRQGRGDR